MGEENKYEKEKIVRIVIRREETHTMGIGRRREGKRHCAHRKKKLGE